MIEDSLAITAVLVAVVAFCVLLTKRFAGAEKLSAVLWILFVAAAASNTGLIPTEAPVYEGLIGVCVPFAVCLVLFVYVSIVITAHMVIVYGVGRLLRLDLGILTMASVATKSRPPTVLAIAELRRDWQHLALPGVIVRLVGRAVGNYIGFGVAHLVRAMLGRAR